MDAAGDFTESIRRAANSGGHQLRRHPGIERVIDAGCSKNTGRAEGVLPSPAR